MERLVRTSDLDNDLEQVLRMVASTGERIVLTHDGEPVAALLSMEEYREWKRSIRHELVTMIQANADEAGLSAGEADELVAEAIREIRAVH